MITLEKPVCATCGSDDIRADAFAVWDVASQKWALQATFDDYICEDCGCESINWIEAAQQ
jgi:hypothetical protein